MPSPFPGMNPYLEHPDLWPDVHNALIAALRETLVPKVSPRYYVALEERTYLDEATDLVFVGRPDVALVSRERTPAERAPRPGRSAAVIEVTTPMPDRRRETYLEVRTAGEGNVITVLELLSPANKRPGSGRRLYLEKRLLVLATQTNLVEVDLLRAGERLPTLGPQVDSDYRVLISRSGGRPRADLIPFGVRDAIPVFPLPLRPGEDEPMVDLGPVLSALYDRARYDLRIDYRRPAEPPLADADAAWAADVLRTRGA